MPEPMDAADFNILMAEFEGPLQRISEALFRAREGDITGNEAKKAVDEARNKLKAYETLLKDSRFTDKRRADMAGRFGEDMDGMRRDLDAITRARNK